MGHKIGKRHRARRGSLQYYPRKRAKSIVKNIDNFPKSTDVKLLGFAAYKAGMTSAMVVENRKHIKWKGEEIITPVTILEVPIVKVLGVRLYGLVDGFKSALIEVWNDSIDKDLSRKINAPKRKAFADNLNKAQGLLDKTIEVRALLYTLPRNLFKKRSDIFEIGVGGKVVDAFNFVKDIIGKEVKISDFIKPGDFVDVFAVSKGKGTQGSIKRFHCRIQQNKTKGIIRKAGSLNPWTPSKTRFKTPQFGQLGFQSRSEFDKRVLKIGSGLNIKGGLVGYGNVGDYILLQGSVPGPKKRLILFRQALRLPDRMKSPAPEIAHISLRSQQ